MVARRSRPVPVVAVAGRSTLSPDRWGSAGFTGIYSLGDYTDRDTAGDPELTRQLLTRIGRQIGWERSLLAEGRGITERAQ